MDPVANVIGAVNCIKISRMGISLKLTGYNTDAAAFRETLKPLLRQKNTIKHWLLGQEALRGLFAML